MAVNNNLSIGHKCSIFM